MKGRVMRRLRGAAAARRRAEAWTADEQNTAWLDELWEAIDAGDLPRVEAAQTALRQPPSRARGWPRPAEVPLEERGWNLPVPGGPGDQAIVQNGAAARPQPSREPSPSRRVGAYARRAR